jgi:hypothetical protein
VPVYAAPATLSCDAVHPYRHPRHRAVSLNLIMGYGGMVSFGHAAYLGIGGYAVGILAMRASRPASCNGRWRSSSRRCSRS